MAVAILYSTALIRLTACFHSSSGIVGDWVSGHSFRNQQNLRKLKGKFKGKIKGNFGGKKGVWGFWQTGSEFAKILQTLQS